MDKRLQVVEQVISSMPTTCQFCDKEFDPKLAEHLDNWKFRLEDTEMSLTCNLCEQNMSERRRINPQTMAKDLVYIKSKINEILTDENKPVSANDIRILKKDIENLFERWLRIENKVDNLQEVERRNNRNINFLLFCIPLLLGVDIFLRFF